MEESKEECEETKDFEVQTAKVPGKKTKKGKIFHINTNQSRGELEVIRQIIAKNANWKEMEKSLAHGGDLAWLEPSLRDTYLSQLRESTSKFNKIPGFQLIGMKNELSKIMKRGNRFFPEEIDFFPHNFLLPEEFAEMEEYINNRPPSTYIFKPSGGGAGSGIGLFHKPHEAKTMMTAGGGISYTVQDYIANPLLINNKKFDLRIYVLFVGNKPNQIFLHKEGIARFATEDYEAPTKGNMHKFYMHLTNYSINKLSDKYHVSEENDDTKRTLTSLCKTFESKGLDIEEFYSKITEIVAKTVILSQPYLQYEYFKCISNKEHFDGNRVFQIYGFDILFDANFKGWLIETNEHPSLSIYSEIDTPDGKYIKTVSEIDRYIKMNLIEQTIKIIKKSHTAIEKLSIYGDYVRIPINENPISKLNLFTKGFKAFEKLTGIREGEFLTGGLFSKICKIPGLSNEKVGKIQYDLLFTKIISKAPNKLMGLNEFFDAAEELAKMFNFTANLINDIDTIFNMIVSS